MISGRKERVDFVLSRIRNDGGRYVVAVDGPCASGKTTLVDDLAQRITFSRIAMDDFFLPPELRTSSRFSERGGNIHYERFIDEVITPLGEGKSFTYRRFSCRTLSYDGAVTIPESGLVIVEGSYALHPKFPHYWDTSFLLSIERDEQIRRLSLRSPEKMDMFISRWIPLEDEYFKGCDISSRAVYTL